MALLESILVKFLTEPTWILRFILFAAGFYYLVPPLWRKIQERRLYDANLPCLPTSRFLGKVMGHLDFFLFGANLHNLEVTVILGSVAAGLTKILRQYGHGLFFLRVGPFRHLVLAIDAKTAEAMLTNTKNIVKAQEYDFIRPWLGQGLLTGQGSHWRRHRKLLTPTFHFQILNKFIPVMNEQLNTLCQVVTSKLDPSTGSTIIQDIRPLVNNCTVDIICKTAMGIDVNAQKSWLELQNSGAGHKTPEMDYVDSVRGFLDLVVERFFNPFLQPEFLFRFSPKYRKFKQQLAIMHNFTNNVILKRKESFEVKFDASLSVEDAIKKVSEGQKIDFLDLLLVYHLKGEEGFDLVSIREEVDTFMFGGHDTTSTTLHFALLLIGLYPEKQKLIYEELVHIFGEDMEREITSEDTKLMNYLEMSVKEVLRLYPPAAFFGRQILEPFQCDKYYVPAGGTFFVLSYMVHRDPKIYKQPEKFIPERFGPNSNQNPFAFIPFSAGPRNCIGQRFAMLELKIFMANILRKFEIKSHTQQDQIHLDFAVISKSNTPIKIEFIPRQTTTS